MNAIDRLRGQLCAGTHRRPLRVLCGSGQLGYGIPEKALQAGFEREPHFVGCDMGSIDPGPYYLGSGEMATSVDVTRRDLELVLLGSRRANIPLLIGTAGTAGSDLHLERVVQLVRNIAKAHDLHFNLAQIPADIAAEVVVEAIEGQRVRPLGHMPELTRDDALACKAIVGQMGVEPFQRALEEGADVIIAGRACDTAIFSAIPLMLGYAVGPSVHMAKIIECSSLCCVPGGGDAIMGTIEGETFILECMNPERIVTPMSAAAHSLYEEADPYVIHEPDGVVMLNDVRFEDLDGRCVRGSGAKWDASPVHTIKLEGAAYEGERVLLLAAAADPNVISSLDEILHALQERVAVTIGSANTVGYRLWFRKYGFDGVVDWPDQPKVSPREVFILGECVAATSQIASMVLGVAKQNLLHYGFEGRTTTAGNVAFPITPPEVKAGAAYRFRVFHVMDAPDMKALFPVIHEKL